MIFGSNGTHLITLSRRHTPRVVFSMLIWSIIVVVCFSSAAEAAANKPPTVSVTAPGNGASYAPPATIVISANALDADGTITRVQFFSGTTLIGTSVSKPYTFTWSNVPAGSYSLLAKATDNSAVVATSAAVSIRVAGPQVAITSPQTGSDVVGDEVTIHGTFVGDSYTTIWVDNGNSTRRALNFGNSTFAVVMPVTLGQNTYNVSVVRRDKTFDSYSFNLNGVASPLLSFKSPVSSEFQMPGQIQLAVNADTPNGIVESVKFYQNDMLITTKTAPPYEASFAPAALGTVIFRADLLDNKGYAATASKAVKVKPPNAAPTIAISSPTSGAGFTSPAQLTATSYVDDSDGGEHEVTYTLNGVFLAASNVAPYRHTWTINNAGAYTLAAIAKDSGGLTSQSSSVVFQVSTPNSVPTVTLASPFNGASFSAYADVVLSADASDADGSVAKVEFYRGTTLLASDTDRPYTFTWSRVAPGTHIISARAFDNAGAVTISNSAQIVVAPVPPQVPPTPALTLPVEGATFTSGQNIVLEANVTVETGTTVQKVEFFNGNVLIGSSSAAPFSITWNNVPTGAYQVTARATDNRGLFTNTSPRNVVVRAAPISAQFILPILSSKVFLSTDVPVTIRVFSEATTVAKVELFDGDTLISSFVPEGNTNGGDYGFFWTPTTAGPHLLRTQVTDSLNVTSMAEQQIEVLASAKLQLAVEGEYHIAPAYINMRAFATPAAGTSITKVEFLKDGVVVGIDSTAPYEYQWKNVPLGTYSLVARVHDSPEIEAASTPVSVVVGERSLLSLGEGIDGSTVPDDKIDIAGTVSAPLNSAVRVNGTAVRINELGGFFANNVQLRRGANVVKVEVVTNDLITATRDIAITSSGQASFTVSPSITQAVGKAAVRYVISGHGGVTPGRIVLQCLAGISNSVEFESVDVFSRASCMFNDPGIHKSLIKIYDQSGMLVYSKLKGVHIASPKYEAKLMRSVYNGLPARLADGNIESARTFVSYSTRPKFSAVFASLGSDISSAAAQLGVIDSVNLMDQVGNIVLHRQVAGGRRAFIIQMVRGDDGIWRIEDM